MKIPADIHSLGNGIEAVVWWVLGLCVLAAAVRQNPQRRNIVIVGMILILFGISDIVEISTGAWWRPWWLFAWKAVCIVTLCWQWYAYYKRQGFSSIPPEQDGS
ncbi:MAG: hypothetical protein RL215_439 [Planctomycetota bacterium]